MENFDDYLFSELDTFVESTIATTWRNVDNKKKELFIQKYKSMHKNNYKN